MFVMFALAGYFLPTFISLARGHRNTVAIFLLNLIFGWTIVGWIVAVLWACLI
jgi:hypothetical protein